MYGLIISHSNVNSSWFTHVLVVTTIIFFSPPGSCVNHINDMQHSSKQDMMHESSYGGKSVLYPPNLHYLCVHLNVWIISLGVMSEAASRVIPLLCGAALPWGLQQHECELCAALETRKAALFLDGCLGFVWALSGTQSRSCPWRGKINDS